MAEVLFVSKPVAPPWNDSSKNLVRDVAGHLKRHSPSLMRRSARLGIFQQLLIGRSPDVWHFFFAPNPKTSSAARFACAVRRVPSVHTVCSLPAEAVSARKVLFADLTVAIVGDIAHSRVARSVVQGLHTLGTGEIRLISPPALAPDKNEMPFAKIIDNLDDGLRDADVVMALRIQRERIADLEGIPNVDDYYANFGITQKRLKRAASNVIVMHPGPMNRGIEIESTLADSPASAITQQVTNGVAVRMAVLERVSKAMASI